MAWVVEVTGKRRVESTTRFTVRVDGSTYDVGIADADAAALAPAGDLTMLVRESFRFLLEREPPEAILRRFDLPIIGRYFPEYGEEIRQRLTHG